MKQSQIETRILSIVDPNNRRRGVAKLEGMSVLALGAMAAVGLVAFRPGMAEAQGSQAPVPPAVIRPAEPAPPAAAPKAALPSAPSARRAPKPAKTVKGKAAVVPPAPASAPKIAPGDMPPAPAAPRPIPSADSLPARSAPPAPDEIPSQAAIAPIPTTDAVPAQIAPPALGETQQGKNLPSKPATTLKAPTYQYQWNPKSKKYELSTKVLHQKGKVLPYQWSPKAKKYVLSKSQMTSPSLQWSYVLTPSKAGKTYIKTPTRTTIPPLSSPSMRTSVPGIIRSSSGVTYSVTTLRDGAVATPAKANIKLTSKSQPSVELSAPVVTYSTSLKAAPTVTSDPLVSLDIQQRDADQQKAQQLRELQNELDRAIANRQLAEKQRNDAMVKLRQLEAELALAKAKAAKSTKKGDGLAKDKRAFAEQEKELAARAKVMRDMVERVTIADRERAIETRKLQERAMSEMRQKMVRDQAERRKIEEKSFKDRKAEILAKIAAEKAAAEKAAADKKKKSGG